MKKSNQTRLIICKTCMRLAKEYQTGKEFDKSRDFSRMTQPREA